MRQMGGGVGGAGGCDGGGAGGAGVGAGAGAGGGADVGGGCDGLPVNVQHLVWAPCNEDGAKKHAIHRHT